MPDVAQRLAANLGAVQERIAAAAARSGRDAGAVRLVAVTKYVDAGMTEMLVRAGCSDIGENRPQVLWEKSAALADLQPPVQWHLIGHLQRNKVDRSLPVSHLIHSVDSARLLKAIDASAAKQNLATVSILLEVNVSGDESKHGWTARELPQVLETAASCQRLQVRGLMTMAAWASRGEAARGDFATLRELRDSLRTNCPPQIKMDELSMGMSGDFEVAIEEGATLVRVGSALFKGCLA